jgi:protein-S-isoprenylcysteine O-methyltransferase Ste14
LALFAICGVSAWLLARVFPTLSMRGPISLSFAAAFVLLGAVCAVLGVASFRRARTTVNPMKPGTATALVTSGIYRVSRNPMYLGFLFLLLGELAWLANPVTWIIAPVYIFYLDRFQIRPEERALRERFGAAYSTYAAQVRRWI